jgi:hypothetical protein
MKISNHTTIGFFQKSVLIGHLVVVRLLQPFLGHANFDARAECCGERTSAANWPPIYIGKESDGDWEDGEDLSLVEFKTVEYKRMGYAVGTDEQLERIAKLPKRDLRRRGANQHTLEKICSKMPGRTIKLAHCLKVLEAAESQARISVANAPYRSKRLCAGR